MMARLTVFLTVVVMGIIGLNVARYVLHEEGRLPLRGTGALVSDGARSGLHPSGFDHTIAGERP